MKEKNLQLDRLVFFCDAVVAIAITLLALNLKIDKPSGEHLFFKDLIDNKISFIAFFLSFLTISIFWRIHHEFFSYIQKVDSRFLSFNIGWLFFIVLLPFSTTLVSAYLYDTAAIVVYAGNVLCITIFQNLIWDHVAIRPDYLNEKATKPMVYHARLACNVAMLNAIIALGIAFISPIVAFIILFTRLPMMWIARLIFKAPAD